METLTHVPENQQQLIDSIQKCMQEGIIPIMQAGTQVGGHSLLDAEWLTGKQVALINIEKIKESSFNEDMDIFTATKEPCFNEDGGFLATAMESTFTEEILTGTKDSSFTEDAEILTDTKDSSFTEDAEILTDTKDSSFIEDAEILTDTKDSSFTEDEDILTDTKDSSFTEDAEILTDTKDSSFIEDEEILTDTKDSSFIEDAEILTDTKDSSFIEDEEILTDTMDSSFIEDAEILTDTKDSSFIEDEEILTDTKDSSFTEDAEILAGTQESSFNRDEEILTDTQKPLAQMIKQLQERVGSKPKFSVENFQNWAGNHTSSVISCYPETKEEMSNVIKAAAAENVVIRCAGARHSWAPVFADNRQICVNTKNLKSDYPNGSNIRADSNKRTVDVMAGVTTGDFKTFQVEQKLSILANVILDLVHVVSVAQTGCHGVGKDVHCVSDYLVKMRVFDANGELRTYSADGDGGDVELFRAVSAGFGCFGVVYDVTIQMDPEVIVKTGTSYPNMKDVFYSKEKLQEIIENNWAVEIFWFPFNSQPLDLSNDELWLRTFNKHRLQGSETVVSHWFYKIKEAYDLISQEALRIVSPFLRASDSCAPHMQWVSFQTLKHILYPSGDIYQELPNAIHFRKYLDHAKVYDLEFVFDYKGDYSRLMKIIEVVVRQVKQFAAKNQYPLNVSLEMRFMTYSDAYLGTGSIANPRYGGTGHVVCIEVLSLKGTKHWEEFSTAVGKEWMELGGVPHLAKQFEHLPDIYADIRQKMAPQIEAFKDSLGKSGVDSSLYMNTGMRKLLS